MKRIVVGAHSGLREWMVQRGTAIVMVACALIWILAFASHSLDGYEEWKAFMDGRWIKVVTFLFFASLSWHAWIGGRDIFMDYIKNDGFRMMKHFGLIIYLSACLIWAASILWS